jgi:hypothetical protein
MSAQTLSVHEFENLYFAYGSNLHLAQMGQRCPASLFIGKATLPGYRWQINKRGVANVVESKGDYVEGLLFSINEKDELTLDRNEGVAKRLYEKTVLTVHFQPGNNARFMGYTTADMVKTLHEHDDFDALSTTTISENPTDQLCWKSRLQQARGAEEEPALTEPLQYGDEKLNRAQSNDTKDKLLKTTVVFHSTPVVGGHEEIDTHFHPPMEPSTRNLSPDEYYSEMDQNPFQRTSQASSEESSIGQGHRGSDNNPRSQPKSSELIPSPQISRQLEDERRRNVNESTPVDSLVYVSRRFRHDGEIREEYVSRMERAISDALKLGMSKSFVDKYMEPFVHGPVMVPTNNKSTPKQAARDRTNEDGDITAQNCENESSGKSRTTPRHHQEQRSRYDDRTRGHHREERTSKRRSGSGITNGGPEHKWHAKDGVRRAPKDTGGGIRTEDESAVSGLPFSWAWRYFAGDWNNSKAS